MARKSRYAAAVETPAKQAATEVWVYARLSLETDRSEDSIENQVEICKSYIAAQGDMEFREAVADIGYTGRDFDRPGYERLMAGIEAGIVRCCAVKDLSRLGRTYIEVGELLFDVFLQHSVRFISVNDNYDSFADDAARKKLLILFKSLINHMYSRDLGLKIRSAHAVKKQRGELTGQPPYGYARSKDGTSLVIDDEAAGIVRLVFDMRERGESANGIGKYLTARGVPSPQQRRYQLGQIRHEKFSGRIIWPVGMVSKMLQNETYTGCLVQNKYDCDGKRHTMLPKEQWIVHKDTHPAIISREQFDNVQALMREAAGKYKKIGAAPKVENRYAGKVICSRCGKVATRGDGGSKATLFYYYCCRHCLNDLKPELGLKRVSSLRLADLDALVSETLRKQMDALVDVDRLIDQLEKSDTFRQTQAMLSREKARLEKTIAETDKTLSAAFAHRLDGLLDPGEYELVREKVGKDRADAETRLAKLNRELERYDINRLKENRWRRAYGELREFDVPSGEMIRALIKRIVLTPITNDVLIELNYMDGFEELSALFGESGVGADG